MPSALDLVVVVPVLGRPESVAPVLESFLAARTVKSGLLFVASPGDDAQIAACIAVGGSDCWLTLAGWPSGPGDFARKVNLAHRTVPASVPFLFQAADDVAFEPGWDREALAVAAASGAGVTGTNDMANATVMRGDHSTHSLIRRSYIESCGGSADGPGTVFSESYGHAFVDNELVELAKLRDCWAFAPASVVKHAHPIWRTAFMDDTYRKGQSTFDADRALYHRRRLEWKP